MSKLTYKIAFPVFLAGAFSVMVFMAVNYDRMDPTFFLLMFLLSVFLFSFGFSIGQAFTSPLRKLLERAEELSKGNLSSRVYIESKDEISELAKVFNKLAEDLEESHEQEKNSEKSVDIKVRARTQALEETINALEQKVRNRTAELENMIKSLEKFKNDSTIKELEVANLRKQIGSLEGASQIKKSRKPKKEEVSKEETLEKAE